MKTVELKNIPGLNLEDVVVIKKLSYGERCDLQEKAADISMDTKGAPRAAISIAKMKLYSLIYSIQSAPFIKEGANEEEKMKAIRALDEDAGNFIYEEYEKLSKPALTEEQKKK